MKVEKRTRSKSFASSRVVRVLAVAFLGFALVIAGLGSIIDMPLQDVFVRIGSVCADATVAAKLDRSVVASARLGAAKLSPWRA